MTEPATPRPRGAGTSAETTGIPGLLLAILGAAAVMVAAIIVVAVSESAVLRVVAVVLLGIVTLAVIAYVYSLLARTGVAGAPPAAGRGAGVAPGTERVEAALVTALRDAHALAHGTARFATAAAAHLRSRSGEGAAASEIAALLDAQHEHAERHEQALDERLRALGRERSRGGDDEAAVAAWLYDRLLEHGVVTDARHAVGLIALGDATFASVEGLAAQASDDEAGRLAVSARSDLASLGARWSESWERVLEADEQLGRRSAGETMRRVLEEARETESMRAALLAVSASQSREAGIAAGAEEAGLAGLVDLIDGERAETARRREQLGDRLRALGHHASRLHAWETFAAARSASLVEHVRGYKLIRDVRDLLAAGRLETGTYELLRRAAERAGDEETARLAHGLGAEARSASGRLDGSLAPALRIALLAE